MSRKKKPTIIDYYILHRRMARIDVVRSLVESLVEGNNPSDQCGVEALILLKSWREGIVARIDQMERDLTDRLTTEARKQAAKSRD